ncbi:MAG: Dabb family protein [Paramuribaculum sp.]|nr:Dabb family protein [Paramuribaculum sp.]
MIKHIVTFRFSGSETERRTVASKFREALLALPAQIPQLIDIEVGININPAEEWDLVLTATAASLEDVAIYSAHPAHKAAVALISEHKAGRVCVDYEI